MFLASAIVAGIVVHFVTGTVKFVGKLIFAVLLIGFILTLTGAL